MITYLKILIYSCAYCIFFCGLMGTGASVFIYFKTGFFLIPEGQIIRGFLFGCIAGSAITLTVIVFKLIDKYKARANPPSDP
ncbi:hypothetical protein EDC52_1274 [Biostraticola tofi]|uniref:Uncharacterized protein n=1 Tax=Biostraticola tofi TaxID=466109 RepID=A0A4R3YIY3_9GAMM|nr:hypothetical protein EDC52_1274 [Biostraticola tofi]